jgi:hypothetical protein
MTVIALFAFCKAEEDEDEDEEKAHTFCPIAQTYSWTSSAAVV